MYLRVIMPWWKNCSSWVATSLLRRYAFLRQVWWGYILKNSINVLFYHVTVLNFKVANPLNVLQTCGSELEVKEENLISCCVRIICIFRFRWLNLSTNTLTSKNFLNWNRKWLLCLLINTNLFEMLFCKEIFTPFQTGTATGCLGGFAILVTKRVCMRFFPIPLAQKMF